MTEASMLLPLSLMYTCSLPHSSHQLKCLERYNGVFRLRQGGKFPVGVAGRGTPAQPSAGLLCSEQQSPTAAGSRNLAVNEAPFPDYAESHHSLRAANVQGCHTPGCSALPASRRDRCLQ